MGGLGGAGWAALIAGAAWLGGIAFGWRLCVLHARRLPDEWADEPEAAEPAPLLAPDVSLAASIPGPVRSGYEPDPKRVQLVPWACLPGPEYLGEYAPVWIGRPERLGWIAEQVDLWAARVLRGEPVKGRA